MIANRRDPKQGHAGDDPGSSGAGAAAEGRTEPLGSPELLSRLREQYAAVPVPCAASSEDAAPQAAAPDDLMGYHLVTAITQDTVNFQLRQLWKRNVVKKTLDITLGGLELHAELDAPTVSFGMTDQRTVLFSLRMKRGTFVYYAGWGPSAPKKSLDFEDWVYTFRVNMNMAEIERQALLNKVEVPAAVKAMIHEFDASKFTIRHLFMDFQNANLATFEPTLSTIKLPPGEEHKLPATLQLSDTLQHYFSSLKGTDQPYILGYSVEAKADPGTPPALFDPTGTTFSTFKDPTSPGLNALNFLSMMQGAPFPTSPHAGLFNTNWVESGTYDGRMVVAAARFREDYLDSAILPKIASSIGVAEPMIAHGGPEDLRARLGLNEEAFKKAFPDVSGPGWAFYHYEDNLALDGPHHEKGYGRVVNPTPGSKLYEELRSVRSCSVRLSDREVALEGTVRFSTLAEYYIYPLNAKTWNGYVSTEIAFPFTIRLAAGTEGRLQLTTTIGKAEPVQAYKQNFILELLDLFKLGMRACLEALSNSYAQTQQSMVSSITSSLTQSMTELTRRVILPAGDVFFFKNITVDRSRNVLLDISYKVDREP